MKRIRLRLDRVGLVSGIVLLVLAVGVYYVVQRGKVGDTRLASDKTLLSLLTVAIVGLLLAFAFVGVRNLGRVLAGRRRGLLGSRLQARVTFAFLLLVLLPSVILFGAAIGMVRRSLSDLAPPEPVLEAAQVVEAARRGQEDQAARLARALARDLAAGPLARGESPARGELAKTLDEARRRYGLAAVGYAPRVGAPLAVASAPAGGAEAIRPSELTRLPEGLAEKVAELGQGRAARDRLPFGERVVAAEPLPASAGGGLAWTALYVGEEDARRFEAIESAAADWRGFRGSRSSVERLYFTLFALLTILVLFAAVWAGFLIARQVTEPILDLARGTEALARGELSYRVAERTGDEVGRLAASFNRMARELERARVDLEERGRYIATLLESIPVGVVGLDAAGRATAVNRAALDVLGLETVEPGAPLGEFLGGGLEPLARALRPLVAGEAERAAGETTVSVRGAQVTLVASAARFAVGAGDDAVLVVLEDLTRLRRAERLAAWGEVARRLAHEIKNPLTPIRLSAERMLRRYRKGTDDFLPVIEEGTATIVREVESIQRLVSEFSRFARLPEIKPRPASINDVVGEALALYRNSHAHLRFAAELAADLPPHRIDPEALRRCLINLLDNAVAVVGADGAVTVRTAAAHGGRAVALEVADNGPGVPPEDRARMFQPDFTRRPGGTGLGLAIVEQVVLEHGGRIRVEDNPGGGARVVIELPAATAA